MMTPIPGPEPTQFRQKERDPIQLERLARLDRMIKVLKAIDPARFCMDYWWQPAERVGLDPSCGTVGCAVGHYLAAGPVEGLRITKGWPIDTDYVRGLFAVAGHFHLPCEQTEYLFNTERYPDEVITISDVLSRVQRCRDAYAADPEAASQAYFD